MVRIRVKEIARLKGVSMGELRRFRERHLGRGQLYDGSWQYLVDPHRTLGWEAVECCLQSQPDGR